MKVRSPLSRKSKAVPTLPLPNDDKVMKHNSAKRKRMKKVAIATLVVVTLVVGTTQGILWFHPALQCSAYERFLFKPWSLSSKDDLAKQSFGMKSKVPEWFDASARADDKPVTVLLFTKHFPDAENFKLIRTGGFAQLGEKTSHIFGHRFQKPTLDSCPVRCEFTTNQEMASAADVILYELSRFGNVHGGHWCNAEFPWPLVHPEDRRLQDNREQKPLHQLWGWLNFEQPSQFPILLDPYYLKRTDFHMNWKQTADIPVTYICNHNGLHSNFDELLQPPDLSLKEPGKIAIYVASRCRAYARDQYVRGMMQHMFVHSYGACLQNSYFAAANYNWAEKIEEMRKFKFTLVFENSNEYTDWVTEKIMHAFYAGTVPVYWGAANIVEFLPAEKSAIFASDFASPKKLAEYLVQLDSDDTAYESYFVWKSRPLSKNFTKHLSNCVFYSECRVCQYYHSILRSSASNG